MYFYVLKMKIYCVLLYNLREYPLLVLLWLYLQFASVCILLYKPALLKNSFTLNHICKIDKLKTKKFLGVIQNKQKNMLKYFLILECLLRIRSKSKLSYKSSPSKNIHTFINNLFTEQILKILCHSDL